MQNIWYFQKDLVSLMDKNDKQMTYYKAIITEKTAADFGMVIANTKSSVKYKNMTKEQFTEATKYISCYKITIKEISNSTL